MARDKVGELAVPAVVAKGARRRGIPLVLLLPNVGLPGSETFDFAGLGAVDGVSPAAASLSRNSTQRRENDWVGIISPLQKILFVFYTSVSSVFSSSAVLVGGVIGERTQNEELEFAE